jgi:hypothetical protein
MVMTMIMVKMNIDVRGNCVQRCWFMLGSFDFIEVPFTLEMIKSVGGCGDRKETKTVAS